MATQTHPIVNIAAYRFVDLDPTTLPALREELRNFTRELGLKGTILLSHEGINLFIAGTNSQIATLKNKLNEYPAFMNLTYKTSPSSDQPFTRMLVKIKREIIAMGHPNIRPFEHTPPHLPPETLAKWYAEGKDMVILDTRNDYEYNLGTFKDAKLLDIQSFREFPKAVEQADIPKDVPVVTFCTGGIRCEKAAELMERKGFKEVYQLDGGILNYFEKVGSDHYDGECFVFDKRVAVDAELNETRTTQCYQCRQPLTLEDQQRYPGRCPYHENLTETT